MKDKEEFIAEYFETINELGLSAKEVEKIYQVYLEDPMQFTEGMVDRQNIY